MKALEITVYILLIIGLLMFGYYAFLKIKDVRRTVGKDLIGLQLFVIFITLLGIVVPIVYVGIALVGVIFDSNPFN